MESNLTSLCTALGSMKRGEKATALSLATMFIASMPVLDFFICPIELVYPCVWSISPEELDWGWSPILPISPGFQLVLATEEVAEMGWRGRLWVVIPPASSCRIRTVMLPSLVPEDSLAADFCVCNVLYALTIMSGVVRTQHGTATRILTTRYFWTTYLLCRCWSYTAAVSGYNHWSLKILQIENSLNPPMNSTP